MGLLERLASEQILRDAEFLGKTRFSLDQQAHTAFYDLTPAPAMFILANGDPYEVPLEALIRVQGLRRDFRSNVPDDNFWIVPVESIEGDIKECVRDLDMSVPKQSTAVASQTCSTRIQAGFDSLRESISAFALAHRLALSEPPWTRDPAPGYLVQVKITPPRARIRVMPLLEFKKYVYFKVPQDQYRWNDLLDTESDMIGWYHYRAEWPSELNGTEEGDFYIKKAGVITFTPPQKK